MNKMSIHRFDAKLTPPVDRIGATWIPLNYGLSFCNSAWEVLELNESQPLITYGITHRDWNNYAETDEQKNIWVCSGTINGEVALSLGLLHWKLNWVLEGKNFVITKDAVDEVSLFHTKSLSSREFFLKKVFVIMKNVNNEGMHCTKEIEINDLGDFKVISWLWIKNFFVVEHQWKFYDLNFD